MSYLQQAKELLSSTEYLLSTLKPSEWAQENRIMSKEVSPFPGPFSYDLTPYLREPIDCLSPEHPARVIAFMKGVQIGASSGLIENGIGWIISQNPGNILFLSRRYIGK